MPLSPATVETDRRDEYSGISTSLRHNSLKSVSVILSVQAHFPTVFPKRKICENAFSITQLYLLVTILLCCHHRNRNFISLSFGISLSSPNIILNCRVVEQWFATCRPRTLYTVGSLIPVVDTYFPNAFFYNFIYVIGRDVHLLQIKSIIPKLITLLSINFIIRKYFSSYIVK